MIAEAMVRGKLEIDTVKRLVEKNADDVYNLEFNGFRENVSEVKKMLISEFDKQYTEPISVPVQSQEDYNKVKAYGGNPVIVPSKVAALLKNETQARITELISLPKVETLTLREKFQRWYDIYSSQLRESARDELNKLINEIM